MKTKEKILMESLNLFASDGYEAVSVQNIADKVGITKGALYRHYKNKRDILDCIVERMRLNKLERAKEYSIEDEIYVKSENEYADETLKLNTDVTQNLDSDVTQNLNSDAELNPIRKMVKYVHDEFIYWTQNEFASNFRKMITLEQYRDWEMSYLYQSYLTKGIVTFIEDYFSVMMTDNLMKIGNPKKMAIELYSPVYMMISMYDVAEYKQEIQDAVNEHLEAFLEKDWK